MVEKSKNQRKKRKTQKKTENNDVSLHRLCSLTSPLVVRGTSCGEPGSEKQHTKDSEEKPTAHDMGQKENPNGGPPVAGSIFPFTKPLFFFGGYLFLPLDGKMTILNPTKQGSKAENLRQAFGAAGPAGFGVA